MGLKGSEVICAFYTMRPHYKQLFKEQAKKRSSAKADFCKQRNKKYIGAL